MAPCRRTSTAAGPARPASSCGGRWPSRTRRRRAPTATGTPCASCRSSPPSARRPPRPPGRATRRPRAAPAAEPVPATPADRGRLAPSSAAPATGERVDVLYQGAGTLIEHILSSAVVEPVDYDQDHDEWVLLVEGA